MKIRTLENLIWILFFIIGLLFTVIGAVIGVNTLNYENKVDTMGTITRIEYYTDIDGDRLENVYVSYYVEQKQYESKLTGYSSDFYEGKEINIYYDKNNPNEIGVKSLDLLFLIFPGIGLIFLIIGATGLLVKINKKRRKNKLKTYGEKIEANYRETTLNTIYSVNNVHPYNIICEWNNPIDNKKYIFKSENLWTNPEIMIAEKNVQTFPVYIDRKNKKKYIVDVDILTENVVDLR